MPVRIKPSHLPQIKKQLLAAQNGVCPLCGRDITRLQSINQCVDHDHQSGMIRAVLCRQCNGAEGKIKNLAIRCVTTERYKEFIMKLAEYYRHHEEPRTNWLHHTHLSATEKRAQRNKKARERYAAKKKKEPSDV